MKYIKHEIHGISMVAELKKAQEEAGWVEITAKELMATCKGKDITDREAPTDIEDMTKRELETYARGFKDAAGSYIELDRRMNKENMLKDFNEKLGD